MTLPNLMQLRDAAVEAAREAGQHLSTHFERASALAVQSKSSDVDLVSDADREAEALIRSKLAEAAPEVHFIGEESATAERPDAAGLKWVVDPLDGTANFLSTLPIWSVSIALCDGALHPQLAVVHAPPLARTWTALLGGGTWLNGERVWVRQQPPGGGLHNAMLATGFPYDTCTNNLHPSLISFQRMQERFHKIRRLGSAAIDLAFVADGTYDGMWELQLRAWDTAAGVLLVTEAGGIVSRFDGSDYTPGDKDLVAAASDSLWQAMCELLREVGTD